MNYKEGFPLLESLDKLKDKDLIKRQGWEIIHIALLPVVQDTLLAYSSILDATSGGNWMANGVNHEKVYRSGVYVHMDGTHFDDDLNFYAITKHRINVTHVEYKCELLVNLVTEGEVKEADIPSS